MASSSDNAAAPAGSRRLRRWSAACAVVAVALWASQLVEIPQRSALRGYDNTFNYLWLRSAMVDGDWDFRNDLAEANTLATEQLAPALALPATATGRLPNKYGTGWAVVTTPFYLVADGIVAAGRASGLWKLERDGWNPVYQVCIQLGHGALSLLALWLATKVVAAWLGMGAAEAAAGVVLVWAASSLLFYQTVNLSMSHGVAFLAIVAMAYGLCRVEGEGGGAGLWARRWPWLLAGAGWGLAVTTRFQLGVFALLPAWVWFGELRRGGGGGRSIFLIIAGAAPFLAIQVWAWKVVYGSWLVFSYGAEGEAFHWLRPDVAHSLFSPWHGLFYWHPFLIFASAGLLAWATQARGFAIAVAATALATLYVNSAWWCWWFGSSFGNRAYDAALLPLMAGLAWLLRRVGPRWRNALWALAIAAGIWNFYLVLLYRTGAISRQAPVSWWQMLQGAGRLGEALRF